MTEYGKNLQRLRISQHEFAPRGGNAGTTLPITTIRALDCALQSYHAEDTHAVILKAILNLRNAPGNLTDRRQDAMLNLGIYGKDTYSRAEAAAILMFADLICNQELSFCEKRNKDEAVMSIVRASFDEHRRQIHLILDLHEDDGQVAIDLSCRLSIVASSDAFPVEVDEHGKLRGPVARDLPDSFCCSHRLRMGSIVLTLQAFD
ncbi:hypothetical protein I542_5219 [Mycobacteroides abscessus 1948]|uniref:Uncharacterized protein n=1 Tax=Mycobacteroides abscessus 1948 TaxID=1299323 RepID=A0A829QRC5_9MYCO|nr:hypothetical protein MA3A0122R_3635 [Mycobacteroides abscessus 3A-0122-R]EIV57830.1 hypothetical protein MA3A0930R_1151 [Mycobacteroides abscessus 3A-0930-R]EIV83325.1 hypothetical protein MM3A0810R_1144 [Mycobacteroides abscessus 3A-0810-R]ETZ66164.1 hypothetical protein L836_0807 [Mycobacteroides abscessus MAB_110811_2726]EUA65041.1 hypothetical protein I542_5219 [Mycobacteroides abscessus 1948]EUA77754.1 hypothetical protein I541_2223 [Mycobacteroides abscessus]EUA82488.1 hypothetical p